MVISTHHGFDNIVGMVTLIYWGKTAKLKLMVLFCHSFVNLLLNCFIGFNVTFDYCCLNSVDDILHELSPLHLAILVNVYLNE